MPGPTPLTGSSYDEVPYTSYPYPQAHPDRLVTVAALFGLATPDVATCRLLELGCASGGHVIPMGIELPDASFTGVDLSGVQIDDGRRTVEALGLTNVDLRRLSITDVDDAFGEFEFIVAHGVFSWVPPDVQDRILALCSERLVPGGLAYVSYNTYPGWHLRGMIRDMMRYHAERFDDPTTRVRQARALLDFLATSVPDRESPYGKMLQGELDLLRGLQDSYLFHEHLEEHNRAFYFYDFVERAARHGLVYVGESSVPSMAALTFPEEVQETLRRVSADRIQAEQYMDFLRNRTFRQTIVCRREEAPTARLHPEAISGLLIGSDAQPEPSEPDLRGHTAVRFRSRRGPTLTTRDPLLKAMLVALSRRWPAWIPFAEALEEARGRSGSSPSDAEAERRLTRSLLRCFLANLVELHSISPPFITEVSERPEASPLARLQAARQRRVTSLRHELVSLGEPQRRLLGMLDGKRDLPSLASAWTEETSLDEVLGAFARAALLRA